MKKKLQNEAALSCIDYSEMMQITLTHYRSPITNTISKISKHNLFILFCVLNIGWLNSWLLRLTKRKLNNKLIMNKTKLENFLTAAGEVYVYIMKMLLDHNFKINGIN